MASLLTAEDIEDELILQQGLLSSLLDGQVSEEDPERQAIEAKIKDLETRLEDLSASTSVNGETTDSNQQAPSSRSSVASDQDEFPDKVIPGEWDAWKSRGKKRAAEDGASTSASVKRVAKDNSTSSSLTASKTMERYRQAEEAARQRLKRQQADAEFAAAISRSQDEPESRGTGSNHAGPSTARPSIDPASLAPPFRLPQRPAASAMVSPAEVKVEGRPSYPTAPNNITTPIDLTQDQHPSTVQSPASRTSGFDAELGAALERVADVERQQTVLLTQLRAAETLSRQWKDYHRQMAARGFPKGQHADSEASRLSIQTEVDRANRKVDSLRTQMAACHASTGRLRNTIGQLRSASGWAQRAANNRPQAHAPPSYNIYEPIRQAGAAVGKKLSQWAEDSHLGQLYQSTRAIRQEDTGLEDFSRLDYPEHYHADVDPRTEEQTRADLQNLFDNMREDDAALLRSEKVELDSMTVSLKPYQGVGLNWLQKMEEGSNKGSILADDMGLGKTIQAIALMSTRRSEDPMCKTNLIIAPVALLRQWQQEITDKLKRGRHSMSVFIHHGTTKKKTFEELRRFDVVLTTFGTLASEQRQYDRFQARKQNDRQARMTDSEKGIFTNTNDNARWYRVIIDEAQNIKNKNTQSAQACCRINAKYRLCMTGTPMMNSVDELYSLIHFLRIPPYNSYNKFQMTFSKPLKSGNEELRKNAMVMLQALLKAVLLRRHKKTQFNGRPIIILPERTVEESAREFSEEEFDFYNAVEKASQTQFNIYAEKGSVGKEYAHVLVMLLRLRQACCHPHLIKDFGAVANAADISEDVMLELAGKLHDDVIRRIKEREGAFECPVCFEATENPAIFVPCGHDTCSDCFTKICEAANAEHGNRDANCPNCRGPINTKRVIDYESFKKVHLRDPTIANAEEGAAGQGSDDDQTDSEGSDSDESTDSEVDEDESDDGDDLKDFIVDDDEDVQSKDDEDNIETASEAGDDKALQNDEDDGDLRPSGYTGPQNSATRYKGKSKATNTELAQSKSKKKRKNGRKSGKSKSDRRDKKKKGPGKKILSLAELKKASTKNKAAKKRYLQKIRKDWISSTKIDATLEQLEDIVQNTDEKVIVFSQWTSLLDLLEVPIDAKGWGYERYDGSMNAKTRADAVDVFKDKSKKIRIMLISLKAGNAGLNLNIASRVIMLDPFWNPYIEDQAIDRAHRLGQTREVHVQRLLIPNTVETRILELQEKKRIMINEALDDGAGQRLSRLTQQELGYLFGIGRLNR